MKNLDHVTTNTNVGREAFKERIYVMKSIKIVAVASGGFCRFWAFLIQPCYPNFVSFHIFSVAYIVAK